MSTTKYVIISVTGGNQFEEGFLTDKMPQLRKQYQIIMPYQIMIRKIWMITMLVYLIVKKSTENGIFQMSLIQLKSFFHLIILKMEEGLNMEMDLSFTILKKQKSILEENIRNILMKKILITSMKNWRVSILLRNWSIVLKVGRKLLKIKEFLKCCICRLL